MSSIGGGIVREGGAADFFGNQRFELGECLGEGAWGVVYEATDRLHDTRVALKVMRRLGPDALFYFKKEFRSLADIKHPNLVRYHELFEEQGRWFLTMELVRGPSFVEFVREGHDAHGKTQRFDEARLRASLVQLVEALDALHRAGKVHRDVKPSNLRVTDGDRVVLLDFGLVLDAGAGESSRLAQVGTAAYMAPEQVHGREVGPLSDFYAAGCILYESLTGRHPFVGEPFDVLAEKQRRDPTRPSELAPEVPPDLDELCMALLSRDLRQRAGGVEALHEMLPPARDARARARSAAATAAGFVGRTRELTALCRAFEGLESGPPCLAYVYGESGIGKSAVLSELVHRAMQMRPDAWVLSARCHEREAVPFKAFDGVIDQLARELRHLPEKRLEALLPPNAGLLPQVFPVLGRVPEVRALAQKEPLRGDAALLRQRVFVALETLLRRLAEERPLLVLIDDVHWADADSMGLLEHLVATKASLPVMFVLTGRARLLRDDPASGHLERLLERAPKSLKLRLPALSESDAEALALSLLGEHEQAADLAGAIARESAGHPLFVYAMASYALAHPGSDMPTLDEAIHASLDSLSDAGRSVLALLAAAGAPLTWEALSRASKISPRAFVAAVAEVVDAKWVHSRQGERASSLEIAHDRVRQLALLRMSDDVLRAAHAQLGDALSRTGGDPESVALHWVESGQTARVPTFARRAADSAVEALAFERAIRLYELALTHCPDEDSETRFDLTLSLASALSLSGRAMDAARRYLELSAERAGVEAFDLRHRAACEWLDARDLEHGVKEAERLLSDLGVELPKSEGALDRSIWLRRLVSKLVPLRGEVADASRMDPKERIKVDVLYALTTALSLVDQRRATDLQLRHLEAAITLGDAYRLSRAFALEAWFVAGAFTGEDIAQSRELARARELARVSDHPHALGLVGVVDASAAYLAGRYRDAVREAERAERLLRDEWRGARWEIANAQLIVLMSYFDTGHWQMLNDLLPKVIAEQNERGDRAIALALRSRLGHFERLLADDVDGAAMAVDKVRDELASQRWDVYGFNVLQAQTELDLYLGDPNAYARLSRVWKDIEQHRLLRIRALKARAHIMRARAALASAYLLPHQRPQLTAAARREAVALERDRSEASRALSTLIYAAIAEVSSERERAIALFGEAALATEERHMPHLAAAARRRQGILLGGEEGRALVLRAERFLREHGASDPGRICAVLVGY